jgi:hypothetical protein
MGGQVLQGFSALSWLQLLARFGQATTANADGPDACFHPRAIAEPREKAIAERVVGCEAFADGRAVRIDDATVYEPDAIVRCGPYVSDDTVERLDPVIIVEVVSPSSRSCDSGAKLDDYFRLDAVRHYLIVKTETRSVIHHSRDEQGHMYTRLVREGVIDLTPPGIVVQVEFFFSAPALRPGDEARPRRPRY